MLVTKANANVEGNGNASFQTFIINTGSTLVYTDEKVLHGAGAVKMNTTTGTVIGDIAYDSPTAKACAAIYVNLSSYSTGGDLGFGSFRSSSGIVSSWGIRSNGRPFLYQKGGPYINPVTSSDVADLERWVRIEAYVEKGTTSSDGKHGLAFFIEDSPIPFYEFRTDSANAGTEDILYARFFSPSGGPQISDCYIDSVAVLDGVADFGIGPFLQPVSNFTNIDASIGWNNVGGAVDLLAALRDNDDDTYARSGEDPSSQLLRGVIGVSKPDPGVDLTLKVRSKRNSGSSGTIVAKLMDGSTVYSTKTLTSSLGTSDADYTVVFPAADFAAIPSSSWGKTVKIALEGTAS